MIFWFCLSTAVVNLMTVNSQNSTESLSNALILFRTAQLMTWLIDMQPAGEFKLESPALHAYPNSKVFAKIVQHFTHKASVMSVHVKANLHSAD